MSASQRLRELGHPYVTHANSRRLASALPLIADCIEAAEQLKKANPADKFFGEWYGHAIASTDRALTALREHLEGGTAAEPDIPIRHRPQDDLTDDERAQVEKELERCLEEHLGGGDE